MKRITIKKMAPDSADVHVPGGDCKHCKKNGKKPRFKKVDNAEE